VPGYGVRRPCKSASPADAGALRAHRLSARARHRFVPYSPLGHGFLTGDIRSAEQLADDDWRKTNPRFTGDNFTRNLCIVDEVRAVAAEAEATAA
jgi:aryl-alcohol dehydrogenase-like predicted oxidoreductase